MGLWSPHMRKPTNAGSNPGRVEVVTRYLAALSKLFLGMMG